MSNKSASKSPDSSQSIVIFQDGIVYKTSRYVEATAVNEVKVGQIINHPNCMKLVESKCELPWMSAWEQVDGVKFNELIEDPEHIPDSVVASCVLQVLLTLFELQDKHKFLHGDLHCDNVMVVKTNETEMKFESFNISIPLLGYKIVIIDYGYSVCFDRNTNLYGPIGCYEEGVIQLWYDPWYDVRTFLEAVSYTMTASRLSLPTLEMINFIDNMANICSMEGLDMYQGRLVPTKDEADVYDHLVELIYHAHSKLPPHILAKSPCVGLDVKSESGEGGEADEYTFVNILASLVKLPLSSRPRSKITLEQWLIIFFKAYVKIEKYVDANNSRKLLLTLVIAVNEGCSLPQFDTTIHTFLASTGQNMISVDKAHTTQLYEAVKCLGSMLTDWFYTHTESHRAKVEATNTLFEKLLEEMGQSELQTPNARRYLLHIISDWTSRCV